MDATEGAQRERVAFRAIALGERGVNLLHLHSNSDESRLFIAILSFGQVFFDLRRLGVESCRPQKVLELKSVGLVLGLFVILLSFRVHSHMSFMPSLILNPDEP